MLAVVVIDVEAVAEKVAEIMQVLIEKKKEINAQDVFLVMALKVRKNNIFVMLEGW